MIFHHKMITLFHSTDAKGLEGARQEGMLYGHELLIDREGYSRSGNLTPDPEASQAFIRSYVGEGQWTLAEGPPHLVMLTFQIPDELVRPVGTTHIFGCPEFVTNIDVDARIIPETYFEHLHAGLHAQSKEALVAQQDIGLIRFYGVPLDFLTAVQPVEFDYRGIHYPVV